MKQAYRIRAKSLITKVIAERLFTIQNGKCKVNNPDQLRIQAETLREKMSFLQSDQQMKKFIRDNYLRIKHLIPKNAHAEKVENELWELYYE